MWSQTHYLSWRRYNINWRSIRKDETRKILQKKDINLNKKKLTDIFKKFLSFDESKSNCAIIVDNYQWLSKLNLISFLRDIGSKFSINRMLGLESIKQRLKREQHLSFLEFNYSIFQAYDFMVLNQKYNCKIQFGGSDQWGNIVSGIDLIKKEKNKQVYGLTSPLITSATGKKMGKTNTGAVWLSESKFSVMDFWQYWRNTDDKDVIKFLKLFTEIEIDEIENFKNFKGSEFNKLKVILANEVTSLCHGKDKTKNVEVESKKIRDPSSIDSDIINECKHKIYIKKETLNKGIPLKQILVDLKLSNSNGESKRLIEQGAVKINKNIIEDKDILITKKYFIEHPDKDELFYLIIFVGKKRYGLIELVS